MVLIFTVGAGFITVPDVMWVVKQIMLEEKLLERKPPVDDFWSVGSSFVSTRLEFDAALSLDFQLV